MRKTEENRKMYEALKGGATYQKIADDYGITKQAVRGRMKLYKRKLDGIRGKSFNINQIVYQGVYDWYKENTDESLCSLSKKMYGRYDGPKISRLREFLTGQDDRRFTRKEKKMLCDVIGKPFKETLKKRDI